MIRAAGPLTAVCAGALFVASCAEGVGDAAGANIRPPSGFEFFDDFERRGAAGWSYIKLTHDQNAVEVVTAERDGRRTKALKAFAVNDINPVSKATATIDGLNAQMGDIVEIAFCMKAPSGVSLNDIFVADIECNTCWSPLNAEPDQSPGVRLQLKTDAGYPAVERGKIEYGTDSFRSAYGFGNGLPRRWTPIVWRLGLGDDETGWVELYVDGRLSVAGRGGVLPDPERFEAAGVRLDRSGYDYFELGVTANASDAPLALLFDNVRVRAGDRVAGGLEDPCRWGRD